MNYDLAYPDLLDAALRVKALFQFVIGDLNGLTCLVLVDEYVTGFSLIGIDAEIAFMLIEEGMEIAIVDLDLVFERVWAYIDPAGIVFGVASPVIILDFLR